MAVYVYAITSASHPLKLDDLVGVGPDTPPLRVIRGGALSAVVSDAPDELRPKRRDVGAHQAVLTALTDQGPVLPMRFGLVAPDESVIAAELSNHEAEYQQRLRAVEGRVEFNLRADQDEDTVLREVLRSSPRVRQLQQSTQGGGGSLEDRIALGEAIAAEVTARHDQAGEQILRQLDPLANAQVRGEPTDEAFLNVSFLVERGLAEQFEAAARHVAEAHAEQGVRCRLYGPLPPYSFV